MTVSFIRLWSLLPLSALTTANVISRDKILDGKIWNGVPGGNDNPFYVANYTPNGFAPAYNLSYCPKESTQVNIPPIIAYYPFQPHEVFDVVGDFFNISWISPTLDATGTGKDNVPNSALRHEPNDHYAHEELLTSYYKGNNPPYGFYHQQIAKLYKPILLAPGLNQVDARTTIIIRPGCDNRATQYGWYFTLCFSTDEKTAPKDFDLNKAGAALVANETVGTKQTEAHLLDLLEQLYPNRVKSAFNATNGCAGVPLP